MHTIYHVLNFQKDNKASLLNAISTREGLSKWWTSKVDGGDDKYWVFHFPGNYAKKFEIVRNDGDRIEWKCVEATPDWLGTSVSFDLEESEKGLTLHFRHSNWQQQNEMFGICSYHWALYMQSLKSLVETAVGKPTIVD